MGKLFKVAVHRMNMSGSQSSMVEYFTVRAESEDGAIKHLKGKFLVTDERCECEEILPIADFLVKLCNQDEGSTVLYSITI